MCEKKYVVLPFCIMQRVEMTLDDGAVKMWGGGDTYTLVLVWDGTSN